MHELQIVQDLFIKVKKITKKNKLKKIKTINIILGEFTGFVDESIDFYWQIITQNTILKNSKIKIKRQKGKLKCLKCGHILDYNQKVDLCPKCKSFKLKTIKGDKLELKSIDY